MGQLGLDGRWLRVNDRLCSILGESREELLAGAHQDVTSPDDLRDELGPLRRLVAGEINTFAFRKRYDHKGGVSVWANLTLSLLRDDQARPESCIAIVEDVTEQMRAEDGLRESERRRLVAMEIGQVFTFEWDLRTDAIKVSPNAPALLGRDAWFSGSHEFFEAIHPDDRDRFRVTLRSIAPGDEEYRTEYRLRMPDGSWTWLEDYARGEFSEEGLVGVHGLTRNISTRKQSEEHIARLNAELKMSLRAFQVVLDTAPVGIHVARDPQCKVITSNRAFDEILGTHRGENVSKSRDDPDSLPFRLFQEGREAGPDELPMQKALARGVPIDDELYDVERADGKRLKLIVRANPIRDASGAVVGGVAVGVDVTALKNAEQALKEADQRKDEFLAMLGHELRNPLAGIRNALQLIRAPGATDQDLAWAYDVTERQMQNLVRLIDDLLDVSRITTGKVRLRRERVDAAAVVARAVASARPFIESRRHELSVTVADVPMPMEGDPTRLEQIIANLLNNAAKYTDEGGHIRLTAEVEGDEAVIRVRDDGVGIAPETLPTLFELFAQADSSIDRARGGLGIGLTLARTLTAMHGGRVSGSSEGAGRGSEFTVRLPLLRARDGTGDGDGGAARDSARAPGRSGPRRVLIVDDNLDTLQGMATLLKLSGHEVVTALDGVSAVATALEQRPEFILLDIGLPGMSGYEVAETLRREGMTDAVLIAVSGYARENDRLRSRQAGFDHHLGKPVELEVVLALLARTR